jgi:dihydrofolate synthase/folylpolyglutamate synthase
MDYHRALSFLEAPARFSPRLGLARVARFLEALGRPQDAFPAVLIAGTSGKGSSCALISAALTAAGWKIGLCTKPHLQCYRERVAVNGKLLSRERLTNIVERLEPVAQTLGQTDLGFPTYFEMGVALAFTYFAERGVDLAVVEVGLGGRLDATNVLQPILCGITPIGFDHTEYLGHTLSEIAGEKSGILKPGTPAVIAPQRPEALAAIHRQAAEVGAPLVSSERWQTHRTGADLHGQRFDLVKMNTGDRNQGAGEKTLQHLFLPLLGQHQLSNAAFALTALELLATRGFPWDEEELRQGWARLYWPGRAEVLQESPLVVIDTAHNEDKVAALAATVRDSLPFRRMALVFGASMDKDAQAMLRCLLPWNPRLFATQARSERALPSSLLLQWGSSMGMEGEAIPRVAEAVQRALAWSEPDDLILVTGSTYVAGEGRDVFRPMDADP